MVTGTALVIGESLVDVVRGADTHVDHPGGSAANVAVALARLGRPTWLATSFAGDAYGGLLADHLAGNAVNLAGDPGAVERTSSAVATLDPSGAASYAFDLDWRLNPVRLPDGTEPVVVHACSIAAVLAPGCEDVFAEVSRLRDVATVSYDVNLRPSISGTGPEVIARIERLVAASDIVKASDEDLEGLRPGVSLADAATGLLGLGPTAVVVTRGGEGVSLFTASGTLDLPALPVLVADTIGAGDTFGAATLHALGERDLLGADARARLASLGHDGWREVLGYAARAAAVTVSRPGADPPYTHELV
ncbi:MAG: carbohydrate kinase [Nocardioides sp.]